LYFDQEYINAFMTAAQKLDRPSRAAFAADNRTFTQHVLPLSTSFTRDGNLHLANLWYFPAGVTPDPQPVVIDFQSREIGYYHVPTYMAADRGDLVYQVALLGLIAIDSWAFVDASNKIFVGAATVPSPAPGETPGPSATPAPSASGDASANYGGGSAILPPAPSSRITSRASMRNAFAKKSTSLGLNP